jgi:hypothetical protein
MFLFELAPDARKLKPGMVIKINVNCTVRSVAKVDALTWKMKGVDDKLEGSVELVDARTGDVTSRRQLTPRRD